MATFSVETALKAPFQVIRRKPLALLVWAAIYLVFGVVPSMVVSARIEPLMLALSLHPEASDPQAFVNALAPISAWTPLICLSVVISTAVIYGAIFRAVLTPEDDKFLYLRLSSQEVWLVLTAIGLVIVFGLTFAVLSGVLSTIATNVPGIAAFLGAIAAIAVLIWILMRLSLSTAIAFAEKRFVFIDSWPMTRGHALGLFGVTLAIVVMLLIGEIALAIPIAMAFGPKGIYGRLASDPAFLANNAPMLAVVAVAMGLFGIVTHVIQGAPWISIYRQLTEKPGRPKLSVGEAAPLDSKAE